ncbi:hypothetical protein [Cryobacterium sp. PH31-O1]|uniref:hypothetical protein n=1 Tax=Cryobacterium sp. PH31-O1 TaxID=3046306 RepID=UPI0024B8EC7D|nr:hypothetical protein [Cryobacterium sp. PH31-O1]MDJ0337480.1 hypothetical protein [Cryobacterium sp. PH31-O1]
MAEQGPEPTPWELMRGLSRVEDAVHQLGGKVVNIDLYAADQARVNTRLRDLETGIRDAKTAEVAADNRADDQKARNRWTLIGLFASPFIAAIAIFITQGGLT